MAQMSEIESRLAGTRHDAREHIERMLADAVSRRREAAERVEYWTEARECEQATIERCQKALSALAEDERAEQVKQLPPSEWFLAGFAEGKPRPF